MERQLATLLFAAELIKNEGKIFVLIAISTSWEMNMLTRTLALGLTWLFLLSSVLFAEDWSQFRGPHGNGFADAKSVPTRWSPEENILWKAKLPAPGNGSAILVKHRVFVTSAENAEGTKRSLICIDANIGEELWRKTVSIEKMPTHKTNPYAGSTPASDGKTVVVWHASAGLHCYDMNGTEVWNRDFGPFSHMWGYGTSPLIHGDKVILHTGPGKKVMVMALQLQDGKTIWEQQEPVESNGETNEDKKYMGSWSTPIFHRAENRTLAIVPLATRVNAYDVETGDIRWTCSGVRHNGGDLAYSSAVIAGDTCFFTAGYSGPTLGIKLGGEGDVTESHRLFRMEKSPQSIGTGVAIDGFVYRPNAGPATIQCIDAKTGKEKWKSRGGGENYWGSIFSVGGLLYATDQSGVTVIFKPNPNEFELVAENRLGEATNATPAVAEGKLFFRTNNNLTCVGK